MRRRLLVCERRFQTIECESRVQTIDLARFQRIFVRERTFEIYQVFQTCVFAHPVGKTAQWEMRRDQEREDDRARRAIAAETRSLVEQAA